MAYSAPEGVRLWNYSNSKSDLLPADRACGVAWSLRFSDDGHLLAGGDPNSAATCVWDLRTPTTPPKTLRGKQKDAAFSPDGRRVATVPIFSEAAVFIWDLDQPSQPSIILRDHLVSQVSFTSDSDHLAGSGSDGNIWIWDLGHEKPLAQALTGYLNMYPIAYSAKMHLLAAGSSDHSIRIWDLHRLNVPALVLPGHQNILSSLAFSKDQKRLVSSSRDSIRVWDLDREAAPPLVLSGHKNAVNSVAFAPDNIHLASASFAVGLSAPPDNTVRIWDIRGKDSTVILSHEGVQSVVFLPDGNRLISGGSDVRLWDWKRSRVPTLILENALRPVALSPGGNLLATNCRSTEAICIWDLLQPRVPTLTLPWPKVDIESIDFAPDGKHVGAAIGFGAAARLWDLSQPKARPIQIGGEPTSVAFAPDRKWLATADDDDGHAVRLWDLQDPRSPKVVLTGPTSYVKSIAFSRGGDLLASASWDGTVRIWDLRQPSLSPVVLTWPKPEHEETNDRYLESVAFSPDGNHIAAGGQDTLVRVWPIWSSAADYVCTRIWRNFSMEEWTSFFGESIPYELTCPNLPLGNGATLGATGMSQAHSTVR